MRLLMLNHNVAFKGGGTFFRALQLGQHLARRGHVVTLVASAPNGLWRFREREVDGVHLVEAPGLMPGRWRYGYDAYDAFRRTVWVSARTFDIVHAFDSRPVVVYPALAARRRGARLVMDWCDWFGRGGAVEQRSNPVIRALLRPIETYYEEAFRTRAEATTVINTALEARARDLGVPPATILRLPSGADSENIVPLDQRAARVALNLPLEAPILGHVGALFPPDAALLEAAFARVQAVLPEAQLILVGNPKTPMAAQAGVWRTGFVAYAELNRYLAACDVLCLPLSDTLANRGRLPSKIFDYFAAGRPTVASAVGDMELIVTTAGAGVVSASTPDSFAERILAVLEDASLRARLGANARRAAETEFNWATLAGQVEALYLNLN